MLPNWQGARIGSTLSDVAAELFTKVSILNKSIENWEGGQPRTEKLSNELELIEQQGVREMLRASGFSSNEGVYYGQTVHPRFGSYRDKSKRWHSSIHNHTWQKYKIETWKQRKKNIRVRLKEPRFLYSHIYTA